MIVLEEEILFVFHDVVEGRERALDLKRLTIVELSWLLLLMEPVVQVCADGVHNLRLIILVEGEDLVFALFAGRLLVAILNPDHLLRGRDIVIVVNDLDALQISYHLQHLWLLLTALLRVPAV